TEKPEVLLCGHLDVVGHPDISVYRSRVADGRVYGPGAGDMKGPLAILLELFKAFHTRHEDASIGLLVTSDEESGGQAGVRHVFEDRGFR
ncbi:MAG: M20/M25/M40 family metallo-hydrolase, partial [Akkermansiaceae bacterium]|nr:M20/M25/M40 family metallo-hydrolase [Akkermansiaceae bacterium]